jgi:hypothetical protein
MNVVSTVRVDLGMDAEKCAHTLLMLACLCACVPASLRAACVPACVHVCQDVHVGRQQLNKPLSTLTILCRPTMPEDFEERITADTMGRGGEGGKKGQKQEEVSFFRKYVSSRRHRRSRHSSCHSSCRSSCRRGYEIVRTG